MDAEQIRKLAVLLNIPEDRVLAAMEAADFEEHFYYNPDVFRSLHKVDCSGIRDLLVPDLGRLRIGF